MPLLLLALSVKAQTYNPAAHTDPINLTPQIHDAFEHFYNLDYEGALSRFSTIRH